MATERREDVVKQARRKRVSYGGFHTKLNVDSDTLDRLKARDLRPYIFNDTDDNIQRAIGAGYDFVEITRDDIKVGSKQEITEGRRKRWRVGKTKEGKPIFAFLMAIPVKYWLEDQQAKEARNEMVDQAILSGNPQGVEPHGIDQNKGSTYPGKINYKP